MSIRTIILSCFITVLASMQSLIAQTHISTATKYTASSVSTISKSFPTNSFTGDLIVVNLTYDGITRSVNSVTDTKGNTYIKIIGPTTWNTTFRSELWYAYNITGSGAGNLTVTATLTGASTTYFQIYITEYSGILTTSDPLDQKSVNTGNSTVVTTGAKTTLYGNEIVYGVSVGAAGILSGGAGFNVRSSANQNIVEDKPATTIGSYAGTFSQTSGNWVAVMATFRTNSTLPVELLSFDAKLLNDKTVRVDWVTSTEINNEYFEVERSHDGLNWISVKRIQGAGNSNTNIHYTAIDNSPYSGLSYYRLKQTDFDGKTKTSDVRTVRIEEGIRSSIKIYPNPSDRYITVEGNNGDLRNISVYNYLGQLKNDKVRLASQSDNKVVVDLSSLPAGIYILQTKNSSFTFCKR